MSAESILASGREAAVRLMVDTASVRQPATPGVMDDDGEVAYTPGALVYRGQAKIQFSDNIERESPAGGHQYVIQRYRLDFPVTAARITEGLIVTIEASPASPHNVGRRFRVTGPSEKTFTTAQRVNAEEIADA